MQEEIKLPKELDEMLELIREIMPDEDGKKLSKQEALKMVLATFLAFVTQEDDENQDYHCSCGHCH